MPTTPHLLPAGVRVSDKVTFGQFAKVFPLPAIKSALAAENRESKRERDLPNHVVVYFVMFLSLFRDASQTEVLRCVYESIQWLFGPSLLEITGKSGISQARSRVGWEPLRTLFHTVAAPLAKEGEKGAFYRGKRVTAIDGSLFDVADTPENDKAFGRPSITSAYPQVKLVSLIECGTHAFLRAAIGSYRDSEKVLAREILPHLKDDMICLADRGFTGYVLFKEASESGAKLLWRARKDVILDVQKSLSDGSYLSTIYEHTDRKRELGIVVRVVEYRVLEAPNSETVRLITNWLEPNEAPALELAHLYHERWEIENTLDELKTHLNASAVTLRSKTPDLVKQELFGLLMGHYAIRSVMHEAASQANLDDDELSFTHAVRVIRRRLQMFGAFPPGESPSIDHIGDLAAASVV
jgi:hypothetical protein